MSFRKLSEKYAKVIMNLNAEREAEALTMAHDAHALTAKRIQEKGQDWTGAKMKGYSQNEFQAWKLNPALFNAPGKVQSFKDKVKDGKIKSTYHEFRRSYGLPVDRRTLTFDGNMWKSIIKQVVKKTATSVEVMIMAADKENKKKVNANSSIVGQNILQFGEDEKKLIMRLNRQRLQKAYEGKN